ncbi:MAG: hypothetical protein JRC86_06835 [Deltaproteobacteria bacterium]|nr:hypothetical protein [Deltaproteobacteria bacterium]
MATLEDVLSKKKIGDEWFCVEAPEELHFWTKTAPWQKDSFKKYGVSLASISVQGDIKADNRDEKYSLKNRIILGPGVEVIRGSFKSIIKVTASLTMRADGALEVSEAIQDFCKKTGSDLVVWKINHLHVFRKNIEVQFARHNPDGTGPSLYLNRVIDGVRNRFYPDITYNSQMNYVGKFSARFAKCEFMPSDKLEKKCSVEQAKKRRLRKKSI